MKINFNREASQKFKPLNVEFRTPMMHRNNEFNERKLLCYHSHISFMSCMLRGRNKGIQCRQSAAMNYSRKKAQDNIKLITKCIEFRHKSFGFLPYLPLFTTLMLSFTYLSDDLLPPLAIN